MPPCSPMPAGRPPQSLSQSRLGPALPRKSSSASLQPSPLHPKTWGLTLSSPWPFPEPPPLLGLRVARGHAPGQGPVARGAQEDPGL